MCNVSIINSFSITAFASPQSHNKKGHPRDAPFRRPIAAPLLRDVDRSDRGCDVSEGAAQLVTGLGVVEELGRLAEVAVAGSAVPQQVDLRAR